MLGPCCGPFLTIFLIQKLGYSLGQNLGQPWHLFIFFQRNDQLLHFFGVLFCAYILKKETSYDLNETGSIGQFPIATSGLNPSKIPGWVEMSSFHRKCIPSRHESDEPYTLNLRPAAPTSLTLCSKKKTHKMTMGFIWTFGLIWGTYGKMLYQCGLYWDWIGLKGFMMWIIIYRIIIKLFKWVYEWDNTGIG